MEKGRFFYICKTKTQEMFIKYYYNVDMEVGLGTLSSSVTSITQLHTRFPNLSPTPGAYSNSRLLSHWRHPTISSSLVPFSSCLQSFPASRSFQTCQFFASGGQRIGVSASAGLVIEYSELGEEITSGGVWSTISTWQLSKVEVYLHPALLVIPFSTAGRK